MNSDTDASQCFMLSKKHHLQIGAVSHLNSAQEGKIAVVVGKVTDDKRLLEVPQDGDRWDPASHGLVTRLRIQMEK